MVESNMHPGKTILVVAAHPDDEILGCGGTIAKHSSEGDIVHVLIVAEGITSRSLQKDKADAIKKLHNTSKKAAKILGAKPPKMANFPDNKLDTVALLDIIQVIEKHVKDIQPDILYTHHGSDLNIDHRRVYEAVITATRPIPGNCYPESIYTFETVSSTEWSTPVTGQPFVPNYFVNISGSFNKKMKALACYESEMRAFPHARSMENIEALATLRGATIGVRYAESFSVVRNIWQ